MRAICNMQYANRMPPHWISAFVIVNNITKKSMQRTCTYLYFSYI